MGRCSGRVPARVTLGVMAFLMFTLTQMIRSNLYITIIAMVDSDHDTLTSDRHNTSIDHENITSYHALGDTKYHWSKYQKGLLLGAFYSVYWVTELPGAVLAQRFGGKLLLAGSVMMAGLLNLVFPIVCSWHYWAATAVRVIQGLLLGVTWPTMHSLSARWIPAHERGKFMVSYHGLAIGSALNYPLGGLLITSLGWEYVFYFTGGLSVIWSCAWWFLVHDSPAQHPHITTKEREYLEQSLGKSVEQRKGTVLNTPWLSILRSGPFWGLLVTTQGVMWGTITLSMHMAAYFNDVHSLSITTNGLISSIPELSKFAFGLIFSSIMDSMVTKKKLSITAARKIGVSTSCLLPGIFLCLLGSFGHRSTALAFTLLVLLIGLNGGSSSGTLPNVVDISPNFAGTILGLIKTLVFIPGVSSPIVASYLVHTKDSYQGWQNLFYITATIYIAGCCVFLIFGSGDVQPWNKPTNDADKTTELQTLKTQESSQEVEFKDPLHQVTS